MASIFWVWNNVIKKKNLDAFDYKQNFKWYNKITKFKSAKYLNQKRRKCTMKRSNKSIRKNNTSKEKNEQRAGTY